MRSFQYAALVVPTLDREGDKIGEYLRDTLNDSFGRSLPIALFQYDQDPANLTPLVPLRLRTEAPVIPGGSGRDVFWTYWRDLSQFDVYEVLHLLYTQDTPNFSAAYTDFWNEFMLAGRAKKWEGLFRTIRAGRNKAPEEANARISLLHLGLIFSSGGLTTAGYNLLRLGQVYQPDSVVFMHDLCHRVLGAGKHLEMILWVEDNQKKLLTSSKSSRQVYFAALDEALVDAGVIAAPSGRSKPNYIRDEPKLWNKFGLFIPYNGKSYFHPGIGLVFNWRQIIAAMSD